MTTLGNHTGLGGVLRGVTNSTESSLKRRTFLGLAAGGAAVIAAPGIASAAVDKPLAPSRILARASGPTTADWTALAKDLAGPLVRPGDSSYATDKLLFDPRFDGQHPAGIAYVKNAHDVSTCLAFVRTFGVPFAARSGGHSYAGWSGSSGLIIDVSDLKTVAVSGTTATVGAGTRLIDFYSGLAAKGRAVPGGSCATVGIAGLTRGGGRHGQRRRAERHPEGARRPVLGPAGRRRGELRRGHLVHLPHRAGAPPGAVHPALPLGPGGPGGRRLADLGAERARRDVVQPAPVGRARRHDPRDRGRR